MGVQVWTHTWPKPVFRLKRPLFRKKKSHTFRVPVQKIRQNFARNSGGRVQKAEISQRIRSCGLFLVALVLGLGSLTGTLAVVVVEHHRTTNEVCECAVLVAAEQGLEH